MLLSAIESEYVIDLFGFSTASSKVLRIQGCTRSNLPRRR